MGLINQLVNRDVKHMFACKVAAPGASSSGQAQSAAPISLDGEKRKTSEKLTSLTKECKLAEKTHRRVLDATGGRIFERTRQDLKDSASFVMCEFSLLSLSEWLRSSRYVVESKH